MKPLPKVIQVPLSHLVEDPNNPNHMSDEDYAVLVSNIREHGFYQPILVQELEDSDYKIVDGHHRAKAAGEAGMTKVLAVVWDGTEEMRQAFAISMNKLRGSLNLGAVAKIIGELSEAGWAKDDLKMTGYTEQEIDDLLKAAQPDTDEDVLDGAAPLDATTSDETDTSAKTFELVLTFQTANDMQKAKRALKRATPVGGELGDGLLVVLAERS